MHAVKMHIIFLLANIFIISAQLIVKNETKINCVRLSDCAKIYNAVKDVPFKNEYASLLNICGLDGLEIKIWCPVVSDICTTPEGMQSTCETIVDCPKFYNATKNLSQQEFINVLPKYICKTADGIPRVCCPDYDVVSNQLANSNTIVTEVPKIQTTTDKVISNVPLIHRRTHVNLLPSYVKGECGKEISENRIYGGTIADITDFPWMALLLYEYSGEFKTVCAGTLINERYILTAAHCLERKHGRRLKVVLGEYNTTTNPDCIPDFDDSICAPPIQIVEVEERIQHPDWVKAEPQFYHDIALLRLAEKVKFNDYVRPICLPLDDAEAKEKSFFTISGWGKTNNGLSSEIKRRGDVTRKDPKMCKDLYKYEVDGQLCIGQGERPADTCTGDSGGPLMYTKVVNKNSIWFQAGVTSLGYNSPCGRYPALYTYVPRYLKWIYDTLKP